MITKQNITNKDLENAQEVLYILKEHEEVEGYAFSFINALEEVIQNFPYSVKELKDV
ncbi:hypothetical protein VPHK460_0262 [Vibrio phage K460]